MCCYPLEEECRVNAVHKLHEAESSYRASGEAIVICGLMHVFTHHLGLTQFASDHVFDIE